MLCVLWWEQWQGYLNNDTQGGKMGIQQQIVDIDCMYKPAYRQVYSISNHSSRYG